MQQPTSSATRSDGADRHERYTNLPRPAGQPDAAAEHPTALPTMSRTTAPDACTEAGGHHGPPRTNGGIQ